MKPRSKLWGAFLLTLALVIAIGGLLDVAMFIGWGVQSTLSQYVADSIPDSGGFYLFSVGLGIASGMLLNHFTGFGMERSDVTAMKAIVDQLKTEVAMLRKILRLEQFDHNQALRTKNQERLP